MREVSNIEDILDVRDIIEKVEELRSERNDLSDEAERTAALLSELNADDDIVLYEVRSNDSLEASEALFLWKEDGGSELATLENLLEQAEGTGGDELWEGDWYPITFIRESYFEEYAKELAQDIGAINQEAGWPLQHIDWEAATDALLIDYTEYDYDGVTYYAR